jgi:hypothetical protein
MNAYVALDPGLATPRMERGTKHEPELAAMLEGGCSTLLSSCCALVSVDFDVSTSTSRTVTPSWQICRSLTIGRHQKQQEFSATSYCSSEQRRHTWALPLINTLGMKVGSEG